MAGEDCTSKSFEETQASTEAEGTLTLTFVVYFEFLYSLNATADDDADLTEPHPLCIAASST